MNIHLVNFYKTWLHWATHEDAENPVKFDPGYGLCYNLREYITWLELEPWEYRRIVSREMDDQFEERGLSSAYPFAETVEEYLAEPDKRMNPKRIQGCIDRIAEAEADA